MSTTIGPISPAAQPWRETYAEQADASLGWVEASTVYVLTVRDLKRFFRQKSRVLGALIQPLIFWLAIGTGFGPSFRLPGDSNGGVSYASYFFPGVLVMVVLFTAIFTTLSVIEDRHQGFLQGVLVAPAARWALVLGKTTGGVVIALIQAALFVALAPLAGFALGRISWVELFVTLWLTAVALSAVGFALAWWLDSVQGYHAVMSVLLIPAWVLSGAMFPLGHNSAWLSVVSALNPLTYSVAAVRRALYGGAATAGLGTSATLEIAILAAFAFIAVLLGVWVSRFSRVVNTESRLAKRARTPVRRA